MLNEAHESDSVFVVMLQVKLANAATLVQPNEGKSQDVKPSLSQLILNFRDL